MCKNKIISGAKAELRFITVEDTPLIVRWRNLPSVYQNLYTRSRLTEEEHLNWLNSHVFCGLCEQFIIYDRETGLPVGSVFIKNINREASKGEYGIFIGEETARGKGIGSEAAQMMLRYGFETIGLNRIYLSVFADNSAAIASYRRAGFYEEGRLRQDFRADGKYHDIVLMAALRQEWLKERGIVCRWEESEFEPLFSKSHQ